MKEYKGTFDVLPEYVSQFGSVEISIEKDDYSTLKAEDAKAKKKSAK